MTKGATILAAKQQIDFPDGFRLGRGMLMTYMGDTDMLGIPLYEVLCTDGKTRPVHPDEVREHEIVNL